MTLLLILLSVLALSALAFVTTRLTAARAEAASVKESLAASAAREEQARAALDEARGEQSRLNALLSDARAEQARLSTRLEILEKEREAHDRQLEERFTNLANDILRRNSSDLRAQNEERLTELLSPLRTNLEEFKKTVTDTYSSEARERFSLTERIRELVELNNTISREARDLTSALKGNNRVQGEWGEIVLETILEKSGLRKGEEYVVQATTDADGNALRGREGAAIRPDVVVRYPDNRFVVIDSKVSLTAFLDYNNATSEAEAKEAADRHVKSVKSHVEKLAQKTYHDYVGSPDGKLDFVMMFIPSEPAYMAAMRLDPQLWQNAYDSHILIVSPTHLVSGLRLIEQLWSRDKVTRNAIRIAEDAGKMYDKFADFTSDMEKIEKALGQASKYYGEATRKLSTGTGNLVKRAQDLRALGIKASKQLAASMANNEEDNPPK